MNINRFFLLVAAILSFVATSTPAMSIGKHRNQHLISGEIIHGDADKFIKEIIRQSENEGISPAYWLDSPGGNIVEAIKIGQLIKIMSFSVRVRDGGICASSCSFLYFSSNFRLAAGTVNGNMVRQDSGYVGLHRPYFYSEKTKTGQLGELISDQSELMRQIGSYLQKELIPQRLIDEMMSRPSNDVYWMSQVDIDQVGEYSAGYEEVLIQKCRYSRQWQSRLSKEYNRANELNDKETMARLDAEHSAFRSCTERVNQSAIATRAKTIARLKTGWRPWSNQGN